MTRKLHCAVPFCRRTTTKYPESSEFLCCDHWRLVPLMRKRIFSRTRRLAVRTGNYADAQRLWRQLVEFVICRAAGVSR